MTVPAPVGISEVRAAADLLAGVAAVTPMLEFDALSQRVGGRVLLKAEHLQRTGSFKIRGATTKLASMSPADRAAGVVAASAGNHAQGVAWAARRAGCRATIVMPSYASIPKVAATRELGAEVVLHGASFDESLEHAKQLSRDSGASLLHAFDDPAVIAGQGTIGLEIARDAPDARRVVIPVGGGGLAAGICIAMRSERPDVELIGVRPASSPETIADGAAVKSPGTITSQILSRHLDRMVAVDEQAISEAMLRLLEDGKQVVEGAGALPLAALLAGEVDPQGPTVVVSSGGNVDPGLLSRVIRHGLGIAGRYLFVRLQLRDVPGELRRVLALLAELKVNVVSVVHHRLGIVLPVEMVEVELTLETRDPEHADAVLAGLTAAGYTIVG